MFFSRRYLSIKRQHRGSAFMVMLVILVIGITASFVSSLSSIAFNYKRAEATARALAQAKEALIGYALSSEKAGGSTARPGNFPCPDTNAPGAAGYGDEQAACSSGGGTTIGRLPWKTLGLPELLDGDGEPLWYAVSDNFRRNAPIINSDTKGSLQVYDRDGVALLTPAGSEAVAIIFAPGSILNGQPRGTNAEKTTALNYLDSANGQNNSTAGGPFIAGDKTASFNDQLIIIRTRDFMPVIERRIAKELTDIFAAYYSVNSKYPHPAPFASCQDSTSCNSTNTICRGRLPYDVWGGSYSLPASVTSSWFIDNQWYRVIYYSAGTDRLATTPVGCSTTLSVSGNVAPALFYMPGSPLAGVSRNYPNSNVSWYLEDAENQNMDDIYVSPSSISNDQVYVLP